MLWVGHGVPKNLVQAHMWLSIASGYAHDPALRSFVETERDEVALDMTPAQIAEAQKLAAGWKPTSSR